MPSQSQLQLRAVILHPAPDRCVIDMETALLQQLLNIAQRERIAKIPPDRTEYDAGFGLTPLEDRGSGYHFAIFSRHSQRPESCNTSGWSDQGGATACLFQLSGSLAYVFVFIATYPIASDPSSQPIVAPPAQALPYRPVALCMAVAP